MDKYQRNFLARQTLLTTLSQKDKDIDPVPKEATTAFIQNVIRFSNETTMPLAKQCGCFVIIHIIPSAKRTAAFGKYLLTLSKAFEANQDLKTEQNKRCELWLGLEQTGSSTLLKGPEVDFKRLALVHIFDIMYQQRAKPTDNHRYDAEALEHAKDYLILLAQLASCNCSDVPPARRAPAVNSVKSILIDCLNRGDMSPITVDRVLAKCEKIRTQSWQDLISNFAANESEALADHQGRGRLSGTEEEWDQLADVLNVEDWYTDAQREICPSEAAPQS